jgi:hypothetical protein
LVLVVTASQENGSRHPEAPQIKHIRKNLQGWVVHVDSRLVGAEKELGRTALRTLATKLHNITLVMPRKPLRKLREVPIWIDVDHRLGVMQYHPSARWLRDHGYDPEMAGAVHIPNAGGFMEHQRKNDQPWVLIHELAHAYHDRVLGFNHPKIKAAYQQAVEEGRYESVLHISGKMKRHYALTDHKEYFAEASEAFFGTNDFYPFVRAELRQHDRKLYEVLEEVWESSSQKPQGGACE